MLSIYRFLLILPNYNEVVPNHSITILDFPQIPIDQSMLSNHISYFYIAVIQVHGEWLVYSNHLLLFPAVVPTFTGINIVRAPTTVIPVECHYKR